MCKSCYILSRINNKKKAMQVIANSRNRDSAMKKHTGIRESMKRKIHLPPLAKICVTLVILLFIGYCTISTVQKNMHEADRMEGMKKLREKAEKDPSFNKFNKQFGGGNDLYPSADFQLPSCFGLRLSRNL